MTKRHVWGSGRIYKPTYATKTGTKETATFWIEFYRDGVRYRENTHTRSAAEAQDILTSKKSATMRGEYSTDAQRVTFAELADDLRANYKKKGNRSCDRLELSLGYLLPFFSHWKAKNIGTAQLSDYIAIRQMHPNDVGANLKLSRGASPATVNRELAALRRAFKIASVSEPPKAFRVPQIEAVGGEHTREGYFSRADFLAVRKELPAYLRGLVTAAYWTGMRLRELTGLRWMQVDPERRTVKVTRFQAKNKRARLIPLAPEVFSAIEAQARERDAKFPEAEFVFFSETGGQILSHYGGWRAACKRAKVSFSYPDADGVVRSHWPMFHDLRRTAATNMANAGVPLAMIMMIGGWRTAEIASRYQLKGDENFLAATQALTALVESEDLANRQRIPKESQTQPPLLHAKTA
jgi:integrase